MNYHLEVINNNSEFYKLREEWNQLLTNSNCNTIFLRWEWLYNWWRIYRETSLSLFIVTVRDGKQLVGISPTYLKKSKLGLNKIYFLGSNEVGSDYLDFISIKGKEEHVKSEILSYYIRKRNIWTAIYLRDIMESSSTIKIFQKCNFNGIKIIYEKCNICPFIKLRGNWKDIFNSLDTQIKNIVKRKIKRLENEIKYKFIVLDTYDSIINMFAEFVLLNKVRLAKLKKVSPFENKNFLFFHLKIIEYFENEKIPKLFFLLADQKPIAVLYIFHYNNKYFYYQAGFDNNWQRYSPGSLLMYYAIRHGYEKDIEEFDFLRGNETYKLHWTKDKRNNIKIEIYNRSSRGEILFLFKNKIIKIKKIWVLLKTKVMKFK